jgi:hypothetical protein
MASQIPTIDKVRTECFGRKTSRTRLLILSMIAPLNDGNCIHVYGLKHPEYFIDLLKESGVHADSKPFGCNENPDGYVFSLIKNNFNPPK